MLETKTTNTSEISLEQKTDWCSILNSYKLGYHFKASVSNLYHSGELTFKTNPNGSICIVKVIIDGTDYTKMAHAHGGKEIPTSPRKGYQKSQDCKKSDKGYRLCWELSGSFVNLLKKVAKERFNAELVEPPILWSNYNGKGVDRGTKFFTTKKKGDWGLTWIKITTSKASA